MQLTLTHSNSTINLRAKCTICLKIINKDTRKKDIKWTRATLFFVSFEHISQFALVFYCRLRTVKCHLGSLNIRIYSQNKNGKRKRKFFPTETATEKCSLGRAAPQFSKCKERLLIILAKSLAFHCTLLFSNKNIFTHLATLLRIPSYNFVTILTFAQQKFESFRRGESTFLRFGGGPVKKVKRGKTRFSKLERVDKKGGGTKIFFKNWRGKPTYIVNGFLSKKTCNLRQTQN